jgi:hypothetical protein
MFESSEEMVVDMACTCVYTLSVEICGYTLGTFE